jgi:molybdopterin-dependent oxidoreductase alpha subunit
LSDHKKTQNQPPFESTPPKIEDQKLVAGGVPAVLSSMKHSFEEMGVSRSFQTLFKLNQTSGFDCPGCAWPDPDDWRSMVEFCENGVKAIAEEATRKRIPPEFFRSHSIAELSQQSDFWLGKQGRLTQPMVKWPGSSHYEILSWDKAFDLIAKELHQLESPDQATFYTSGRTSNEAAFLYQLFVRRFGTNNLPDCSNMCHESSGVALTESIGIGKGSVTLEDFEHTDCIFVIGQNPGTNHPRMLTALQKAARNHAQIISINPLQEAGITRFKHPQEISGMVGSGTALTTHFLPVRINGDVALLKGIMKEMLHLEEKSPGTVFNHDFIRQYTVGFSEWIEDLRNTSWELIVNESGINKEEIQKTALIASQSKRMIICWAMGLTQHINAVANIQLAINLLLLGGHFGRSGAGACPVRGHSNVQGDRTMGISEKMPEEFLRRLGTEFCFEPPRHHGLDTVHSIQAMADGRVKVFIGLGGNFLSATPDTEFVAKALNQCSLTVHISTKLNRSHLITGSTALILPCLGRSEVDIQNGIPQFVSMENSMGIVHSSQGNLSPASEQLKSEVAIISGIAQSYFSSIKNTVNPVSKAFSDFTSDYSKIRDIISRVIPGFENYNERIKKPGGFYLPHSVRDQLVFKTATGKAHFKVHPIEKLELSAGHFLMMTIRSHDQFNTTIYGLNDRYRGIYQGRRVVLIHPKDMEELGLHAEEEVDLISHYEGQERIAEKFRLVPYSIPRRCIATYFPETNVLVPLQQKADKSHTPAYKSVVVSIRKRRNST